MISKITLMFGIVCTFLVLLLGCSGIKVSQDYKSSRTLSDLKTFAWKNDTQGKTGDIRIDSPFIDERIRSAIDTSLMAKGLTLSASESDVYLAYNYSLNSKLSSTSTSPRFGFGLGFGSRHSAIGLSTSTGSDINQYDEGQLVIDLTDRKTNELIWRGTSTGRIDSQSKPEQMTLLLNKMVEENLAQFPPEKK